MGGLKELLLEDGRVTGLRLEAESGDGPVELKGTVVLTSGGEPKQAENLGGGGGWDSKVMELLCFSFKYYGYSYLGGERWWFLSEMYVWKVASSIVGNFPRLMECFFLFRKLQG